MNLSGLEELNNKEYRHGLVNAQIEIDLPLQIRALRKQLVGTQPDLSKLTGMKQPRISAMEKPGGAHFTLETLRRLAEAFDVALIVRFAPFSDLLDWSGKFNPDTFRVPSFDQELKAEEIKPVPQTEGAPAKTQGGRRFLAGAQLGLQIYQPQTRQIATSLPDNIVDIGAYRQPAITDPVPTGAFREAI